MSGTDEFVQLLKNTTNLDTRFIMTGGGLSVSYKKGS
jgi:hypothetical protein